MPAASHQGTGPDRRTVTVRRGTRSAPHLASRVRRGAVLSIVMLVALSAVIIWQRDTANLRRLEHRMQSAFVAPLRAEIDRLGRLPLRFPAAASRPETAAWARTYPNPGSVEVLRHAEGPVVVGHSTRMHLFLKSDGYLVAVYDGGRLDVQWMHASEFEQRLLDQERWVQQQLDALRQRMPRLP
jgi:hypothetical protein